jgi:hypothetical protein
MKKLSITLTAVCVAGLVAFLAAGPGDAATDADFWFHNLTGGPIQELYVAQGHEDSWGPDRLGEYLIEPNQRFWVAFRRTHCRYDIKVVWTNGATWERPQKVDLCELTDLYLKCNSGGCWTDQECKGCG